MKRFHLLVASSLVCLAAAAHADTIINLNATNPGKAIAGTPNALAPSFFQTITLGPGSYTATIVNTSTAGAVYGGWSQSATGIPGGTAGTNSWEERVGFSTGGTTFSIDSNGNYVYNPYPNGVDAQIFTVNGGNCHTAGACFDSASQAFAGVMAANTSTYSFNLATSTAVTFYIPDSSAPNYPGFTDNTGGASIDLKAVTPEPSSLILLGTGILGVAGAARRKFLSA